MKKKIIFFINDLDFFISHRLKIAQALDKNKFDIFVACPKNYRSNKILKKNKIKFLNVDLERTEINIFKEFKTLIAILRILKKIKPDIIHLITLKPIVYGGLLSIFFKNFKVIFSIAGLGHIFFNKKMYIRKFLFIQSIKIAVKLNHSILIFQNRESVKHFKRLNIMNNKTNYILTKGSGVDLNFFKPEIKKNNLFNVLLASRMVWEKGVKEFIEAYKIINKKKLNINFILAGGVDKDSPSAINIEYLKKLNSHKYKNFKWIGFQKNIKKTINSCNLIVLPSYHEGAPKVLLEAAACGKPIIASNINGCREIVTNNYNGFLIPIKNSNLLANKIEILFSNKKLCEKMGRNSLIKAKKSFNVEKVIQQHIKIYEK